MGFMEKKQFRGDSGKQCLGWRLKRCFRVLVESVPSFLASEGQLRAAALTYYTLFSIVPVFALFFGIAKGFGLDEWLKEELQQRLQNHQDILNWLYNFADTTLRETRGGLVAGVGALLLFYTVIKLIGNIEKAFNRVWMVPKDRTLFRKFTDYLSFLVIAPILMAAAGSANVMVTGFLTKAAAAGGQMQWLSRPLTEFAMQGLPFVLAWALFAFIYAFLPNTRVNISAAVFGGVIAGTCGQLLQEGYIFIQMALSRYNVIYGSFSALPLFLFWMFINWMIVLYGATLSRLFQNFDYESRQAHDEKLTKAEKRLLALLFAAEAAHDFQEGKAAVSEEELLRRCGLSRSLTKELLHRLVKHKVLIPVAESEYGEVAYQPAVPLENLTMVEVFSRLDDFYPRHPDRQITSPLLKELEAGVQEIRKQISVSAANRPLAEYVQHDRKK